MSAANDESRSTAKLERLKRHRMPNHRKTFTWERVVVDMHGEWCLQYTLSAKSGGRIHKFCEVVSFREIDRMRFPRRWIFDRVEHMRNELKKHLSSNVEVRGASDSECPDQAIS